MRYSPLVALLAQVGLIACQDVTWCKDKGCKDCPSGLASSGPGFPECVVYDSNTVFGGQGFNTDTNGKLRFKVFGNFKEPCGGAPGNYMIRSPASVHMAGCGNIVFSTTEAQCSGAIDIQDTFMVQFCCGTGDCDAAHVPAGRRGIDSVEFLQGGGVGSRGAYLQFDNGTIIEPLAIGSPPKATAAALRSPEKERRCYGYKSYTRDGDDYFKTIETQVASTNVPAQDTERTFEFQHTESASKTTTFDVSLGDPWGVINISTGTSWEDAKSDARTVTITVPAGQSGYVGWTPFYRCTRGTMEKCDGSRTAVQESCAPYVVENNIIRGDYTFVQT
ncbi:hypothetical protein PG984_005576 [Apiospora sp. TS-2023a]